MYRVSRCSLFGAAVVLVLLCSGPALAGDESPMDAMGPKSEIGELDKSMSEEALKEAKLHFSNGVDLLQADPANYQDAYYQFQLALEKSGGSWKVRGNLGYCALKLERDGEALEHYDAYLTEGGEDVDAQERTTIEKELLLLRGNLAMVVISSTNPAAQITVQRDGSSAPAQSYELKEGKASLGLRSGAFSITARADGEVLTWTPVLTPGKELSYNFDFEAAARAAAPAEVAATPSPPEEEASGPSGLTIAGYATAGVGVLALGGGVVAGLLSQSSEDKAKEDCVNLACPTSAESDKNRAESLASTANILFIAGGVIAATGITLVILGGSRSKQETALRSLQVTPSVVSGGGGLFARGSF